MKRISDDEFKARFLAWQCRIRLMAARQNGGRPTPGMRPRVLDGSGNVLMPAMTVLVIPANPHESTAFFRFQVQKTPDPRKVYESALAYLQGDYFSRAADFADEMTALFAPDSRLGDELAKAGHCLLEFAQYGQTWRMACSVDRLASRSPARQATLWHNRAFNPDIPGDAIVLGFRPDWHSAATHPLPTEYGGA